MGNQLIREQIIEILESDYCDGGPTIGSIADKIGHLVNQEVERRIKERMPSEEDAQNAEARYEDEQNEDKLRFDTEYCFRDYMNGWEDCRSRLTTPGDSQKTEGGTK